MTFDDQLKRTFDTLTECLREEVDRQVRTVAGELATAAHAERDEAANQARLAAEQAARDQLEAAQQSARDRLEAAEQAARDQLEAAEQAARDQLEAAEQAARDQLEAAVARARLEAREEGMAVGYHEGHHQGLSAGSESGHDEGHAKGLAAGQQAGYDEGHEKGLAAGRQAGHDEGHEKGLATGRQAGHDEGLEKGLVAGRQAGHDEGHEKGLAAGRQAGHDEGLEKGLAAGRLAGHDEGHEKGFAAGRQAGHDEGHETGLAAGREAGREEGLQEGRRLGVLEGRAQAEQEKQAAVEAALADAALVAASTPAPAPARTNQLADSVRLIGRATSLTGILDALVTSAAREAARAGVWLVRGASLHHWRSTGFDAPDADVPIGGSTTLARAARSDVAESGADGLAVPIAMSGEVVAVLYVANPDSQVSNSDAVEVLTRYAARCLEALTAFKAARALTSQGRAPAAAKRADAEAIAEADVSARRYARLLVSEIKLYHEAAVVDGRRDRDLASRLGGEIARARTLYEERVPLDVRLRVDYFHDELVRTLADGDATLLQLT